MTFQGSDGDRSDQGVSLALVYGAGVAISVAIWIALACLIRILFF